ncbi:hypothetical protein L208DRAFT_1405680 [Tricholoma matsutake]|nr:hypothetical protein L208DRAFT_1405680 [Tricholoma matsutake 945]
MRASNLSPVQQNSNAESHQSRARTNILIFIMICLLCDLLNVVTRPSAYISYGSNKRSWNFRLFCMSPGHTLIGSLISKSITSSFYTSSYTLRRTEFG